MFIHPLPLPQTIDESLRRIFQFFAAFGDRTNKHTLSDFKFVKVLKHADALVRSSQRRGRGGVEGCCFRWVGGLVWGGSQCR
jgi:hypothetical protein